MGSVVTLAGGLGTRLSDTTKGTPKALVKIGSQSIIKHQLAQLRSRSLGRSGAGNSL